MGGPGRAVVLLHGAGTDHVMIDDLGRRVACATRLLQGRGVQTRVVGDGVADTLGRGGFHDDPLWRVRVQLTGLEQDLLRCWWVRRLAFVAHAGAAAVSSSQAYSRLDHSLGLLALVAHLAPDDRAARAAALVHDVGHLPLSHTFEGVDGLDHHGLGRDRVRELGAVFAAHAVDVEHVVALVDGDEVSPLHGPTDGLRLDHLESWLRGGEAHGRTREPPSTTLARLRLRDGSVETDRETAAYVVALCVGEARWRTSVPNVVATGLVRHLATTLLAHQPPDEQQRVAAMTDSELWALLLAHPSTGPTADAFRRDPAAWTAVALDPADDGVGPTLERHVDDLEFDVGQLYLDLPTVDGRPYVPDAATLSTLSALPRRFLIRRERRQPRAGGQSCG